MGAYWQFALAAVAMFAAFFAAGVFAAYALALAAYRFSRMDGGRTRAYHNKFRSFVDDCYFKVTVKENTSGLTKVLNIRFDDEVVTGVSVNTTEMQF